MTLPHIAIAIIINLLWGSMYIAASFGLQEFPPIFFTGIRFLLLLGLLGIFIPVPRKLIAPLFWIGLLMGVGMYLTLYMSVAMADNIASIAIFGKLEVPFAVILGVILLKEKIGIKRIAGISIAMVGAAVIGFDPAALDDLPALFWMGVSCAFAAYAMIKIRQLGSVHPLTITGWVSLAGAPVLLATSFLFEDNHWQTVQDATWVGWGALLYTAIMSSIIAHSGLFYLLQRYPVGHIAPFYLLSPVFAIVGAVFLLDDELTPGLVMGSVLILFGVGWITRRNAIRSPQ